MKATKHEVFKHSVFNKEKYKDQLEYWLDQISGELKPVDLTGLADFPAGPRGKDGSKREIDSLEIAVPGTLAAGLIDFAKKSDLALYVILLAAFKAFLARFTRDEKSTVVSPPLNLGGSGSDEHAGYNRRVLLRDEADTGLTFKELLVETKNKTLKAYKNQNYPLDLVFKKKGLDIDDFAFLDRLVFLLKNLHKEEEAVDLEFELLFSFARDDGQLGGNIHFNRGLFKKESVERLAGKYIRILTSCFHNRDVRVKNIPLLSDEELRRLMVEFNDTGSQYPENKTIHQLFEEQVERTPGDTAIVFDGNSLSYRELNEKANQTAHLLRKKGVGPGQIAALVIDNSFDMITGILGILKAGGAYLPITPDSPKNRILSILRDSAASLLLSREELLTHFPYIPFQDFEEGRIRPAVTPRRAQVRDLDQLQIPDRSSIDYEKYGTCIGQAMVKHAVTIHMSRGCAYNCAFCFKIWSEKYVIRSAENIFNEISTYYKMGVRRFAFVDDLPNINVKVSSRLFQKIVDAGMKVHLHFPNGIRGDILTKDYIDLMVKAGTVTMDLALETTSPRLQKLIRKNLDLEKLAENIEYITRVHPQVILELQIIHGIPSETGEEAGASLDFIKNIKWVHFPYIHILNIYPGSDMAKIAVEHGISEKAIEASADIAYHELPETLPFAKEFTRKYQAEFLDGYFLLKERLINVLPYQMNVLTEDELVQKYNSYLPMEIGSFDDLLNLAGISRGEIKGEFLPPGYGVVPDFNRQLKAHFPAAQRRGEKELRILLLDLSQYFTRDTKIMYDVVEPPLGLMYLLTHLDKTFGAGINGKIAKSRVDFDSFDELKILIRDFKPDVIGIRTLNFYKDFFHKTISLIRQWGVEAPVIAGGPYATSNYLSMLRDKNIDLAVLGEGEITLADLIGKIIENGGKLPGENILETIPGLAYVADRDKKPQKRTNREILLLDRVREESAQLPVTNPGTVNSAGDPAYIIYTSGSTGNPKGVLIQHRGVVNQVTGLVKKFSLDPSYRYLLLASFTFDVSVMHIFTSLSTGARLSLIGDGVRKDSERLWQFIYENKIDILNIVPAFMKILLQNIERKKIHFRYLFVGGDVFDRELYEALEETFDVGKIINIYGPTETTINAVLHECEKGETGRRIPIGKPLPNYRVYITDRDMNLLPAGVPGELCIAGAGVAPGYLNRPELTAEKFVISHLSPVNGQSPLSPMTLYRTGDLARRLPGGGIDFLGRVDNQVKIRGFRIEPGEIESLLLNHENVRDAAVLVREDAEGEKYLCAYVTGPAGPGEDDTPAIPGLKDYLAAKLPAYMVPTFIVRLEKFPLTPGGKVDRKSLPDPSVTAGKNHIAPRTTVEKKLLPIWSELLGLKPGLIGIDSGFFELGGHSLKATILIARIHKELNIKIPLAAVFENPTIRRLSEALEEFAAEKFSPVVPSEKKEYYPLSSAQKRMYFLWDFKKNSLAYNLSVIRTLNGEIDTSRIETAFAHLVERHESLRTSFEIVNGDPVQKIHETVDFGVTHYEPDENQRETWNIENTRRFVKPFDLSRAPLLRVTLIGRKKDEYILVADMHHIVSDGVTLEILIREFTAAYSGEALPPLKFQYRDFSEWQGGGPQQEAVKKQENYWVRQFEDEIPALQLPTDYVRPAVQSFEGRIAAFEIGGKECAALKQAALGQNTTLYMVLLALYNVFLVKITGRPDIIVGTPVSGRGHADLQQIIGLFVNTLCIRNACDEDADFNALLAQVRERTLEAFENQDYQFEELLEKINIERDISRNPLFDTLFTLDTISESPGETPPPGNGESNAAPVIRENTVSKFDLALSAAERGPVLRFRFEYCTGLFRDDTVLRFVRYFKNIVSSVTRSPGIPVSGIDIIPPEEKRQLLFDFNHTGVGPPEAKTIHELFGEQAEKTPDRIAVNMSRGTNTTDMTYSELNRRSGDLAALLEKKGVRPGSIVGIVVERSPEMIAGLLAILKTGGAYLPIDPVYPAERVNYMLKDSNAAVVLSSEDIEISLDNRSYKSDKTYRSYLPGKPGDLAYVIYTSGSTGKPKGVAVEHRGVVRLVRETNYFRWKPGDRLLLTGSIVFDITTFEIWGPLLNGAALYLADQTVILDSEQLKDLLEKNKINILHLIPQLFNQLADRAPELFRGLEHFLVGGDLVRPHYVNQIRKKYKNLNILHMYGPTESTTFSTFFPVDRDFGAAIPIGKPIGNSTVYIVDKHDRLTPMGVIGELIVGGEGVARGYLNNPGLTNSKFQIPNYNTPVYRTGDLGRWLPDGNIEFSGRSDHQVKIRGFRIELEEIENRLTGHPGVKEAVVLAGERKDGDKYLCAYIVSDNPPMVPELERYLSRELPAYMIPAYFVPLEKIPLTHNGKIDKKALPEPELKEGEGHRPPGDEIEKKLAEIWAEVLEIEKDIIGMDSNFFRLGGHSLKATKMIARVHKEFDMKISIVDMFKDPTLDGIASLVKVIGWTGKAENTAGNEREEFVL